MGLYLHPPDYLPRWLQENAIEISFQDVLEADLADKDALPVCLVPNPYAEGVWAAGVIYDDIERAEFTRADDPRPKTWWLLEVATIREMAGEAWGLTRPDLRVV